MPNLRIARSLTDTTLRGRSVGDVTFTVLSDTAKMSFRGRASAVALAGAAFGVALPQLACRFATRDNRSALWLGPDEWLLQATGEVPAELFADLAGSLTGQAYSLVDVSHRSDAFSVSGPKSEYVLNHGCPLDLSLQSFPVGMCTRTIIGKATVLLSRPESEIFHIDVWRSFAPYVWRMLDEAGSELA